MLWSPLSPHSGAGRSPPSCPPLPPGRARTAASLLRACGGGLSGRPREGERETKPRHALTTPPPPPFFQAAADKPQVTLLSSDQQSFKVDVEVAEMSTMIKNMIAGEQGRRRERGREIGRVSVNQRGADHPPPSLSDTGTDDPIPLPNVSGKILSKVGV